MEDKLIAKGTITLEATASQIWTVLTTPETIQQFMLGMQPESDWKVGSKLNWVGRHQENPDNNAKGKILKLDPNKELSYTFFFPGYGYPDEPKYYNTVSFMLAQEGKKTKITVTQGDFSVFKEGETFCNHSQEFWNAALLKIKELFTFH